MPVFPTGYQDRAPSRTSKLFGDTGTANGNFSVQQILDLITLLDLPPGTAAGDYPYWNGTAWAFGNDATVSELSVAAALADANQFALDQAGTDLTRASLSQLYTYMRLKFVATNGVVEDVAATVTDYTFVLADKNKTKRFLSDTGCIVRVPSGFSPGYAVGWIQRGTGTLQFGQVDNSGQLIYSAAGLRSGAQHAAGRLLCDAPNLWNLSGFTMV